MTTIGTPSCPRARSGRLVASVLTLVLTTGTLTACGDDDGEAQSTSATTVADGPSARSGVCDVLDSTSPVDVSFGLPSEVVEYMPWQVGAQEGLFEERGINLEIRPNIKPTTMVAAVVEGSLDIDAASGGLMVAALGGAPVRRFMDTQMSSLQGLWGNPEIQSVSDLKGKKIAITALGGAVSESVLFVLQQEGLDTAKDVELIATGTLANSLAALQAGQVAAAVISAPLDVLADKAGFKKVFAVSDYVEDSPVGLGTSVEQLEGERDTFLRFIDATLDAIQFVRDNEVVAVEWIAAEYSLSEEDATRVYEQVVPTFVDEARASVEAELQELASSDNPKPTEEQLAKTVDYSLFEDVIGCRATR